MKKPLLALIAAPLILSSCATVERTQTAVTRAVDMLEGVTSTVDTVLNRPAPLANTQVDENLIRGAYTRFDQGLDLLNLIPQSVVPRNSPAGHRIHDGILLVKRTLRAAYTAQRIGNAPTVRQALSEARAALTGLTADVQGGN